MGSAGHDGSNDRKNQPSRYEMSKRTSGKDWSRVSETPGGRWGRQGVHLGKGRGDGELRTEGSAERLEDADQVSAGL